MLIKKPEFPMNNKKSPKLDENLFERIANDDMTAFEELYNLTDKIIYAYILSILKNPDDSKDVMQDTYLKIRSAAHLYQKQGKPLAWIFTIAKNLSLMKIRSNEKYSNNQTFDDLENDITFSTSNENKTEDRIVLDTALKILNEQDRQIVILHAVSGMKHIEIAKNLDIPLATVLSKYNRALKKLKKYLKELEF